MNETDSTTDDTDRCGRCGDGGARPVENVNHDRLCEDCYEWENKWRVKTKWGSNSPTSGAGYRTVRVQADSREEAIEKAKEELSFVRSFSKITTLPPRNNRSQYTETRREEADRDA